MKFMNSYLTVNTLCFNYEEQPLLVVETNKYNVRAKADFFNVKRVVPIFTTML